MNDEILYNKIYEQTKEFGRTQFIKEIMRLERENKQLRENNQAMQEEMARTWKKLEVIKKLKSWLEKKLSSDNYNDGMYYGFKICLSKLNELEGGKND